MPKFLLDSALFIVVSTGLLYFAGYVYTESYYHSFGLHMSLVSISPDEVMMMGSIPILIGLIVMWLVFAFVYYLVGYAFKKYYRWQGVSESDVAANKWLFHTLACLAFALLFISFVKYCGSYGRSIAQKYTDKCRSSTYEFTPTDTKESVISGCLVRYSLDTYWVLVRDDKKNLLGLKRESVTSIRVINEDNKSP